MNDKLAHIKSCVETLASIIEVPDNLMPTYGNSHEAHPNIEVNERGELSYEISERGKEIKKDYALDLDHLLYIIFRDITYSMAFDFAAKHPQTNIDTQRIRFHRQLELLGKLKKEWQQKEKEYQDKIIIQFPFNDYEGKRQTYLRELMGNGFLYNEALEKVNEKYP